MNAGKKVLVTGATGAFGNRIISRLLESGYQVTATSRNKEKAGTMTWFSRVTFVEHDMGIPTDGDLFVKFGKPDLMIHTAWEGLPKYLELFHLEKVLPDQIAFLQNILSNGLKDLTVTGTCMEYGMVKGKVKESAVTDPVTAYGIAKDTLRKYLAQLSRGNSFSLKWLRLFYLYGNGLERPSVFTLLDQAIAKGETVFNMSGGKQVRDFLLFEDAVDGIVQCAAQKEIDGPINLCGGKPVELLRFIKEYIREKKAVIRLNTGYYPYLDYEPMSFWGDNTKLGRIIRFGETAHPGDRK